MHARVFMMSIVKQLDVNHRPATIEEYQMEAQKAEVPNIAELSEDIYFVLQDKTNSEAPSSRQRGPGARSRSLYAAIPLVRRNHRMSPE